jgi:hypothetical protein
MDCRNAIVALERCFDEGAAVTPELKEHLGGCAACSAKANELESLERMLHALPIEAPEGIESRVKLAIIQDHSQRNRPIIMGVLSACALLCAGMVNWLLPPLEYEEKAWNYLRAWIPDTPWLGSGRSYREQFEIVWSSGLDLIAQLGWFPASVLWSALATTLVLLVILNGVCTARVRQAER